MFTGRSSTLTISISLTVLDRFDRSDCLVRSITGPALAEGSLGILRIKGALLDELRDGPACAGTGMSATGMLTSHEGCTVSSFPPGNKFYMKTDLISSRRKEFRSDLPDTSSAHYPISPLLCHPLCTLHQDLSGIHPQLVARIWPCCPRQDLRSCLSIVISESD